MRRNPSMHAFVFDSNPIVRTHLVPCILRLYVDIEFTGRNTQFSEKFHMRSIMQDILKYIWTIPEHQVAWSSVASKVLFQIL